MRCCYCHSTRFTCWYQLVHSLHHPTRSPTAMTRRVGTSFKFLVGCVWMLERKMATATTLTHPSTQVIQPHCYNHNTLFNPVIITSTLSSYPPEVRRGATSGLQRTCLIPKAPQGFSSLGCLWLCHGNLDLLHHLRIHHGSDPKNDHMLPVKGTKDAATQCFD